MIDDAKTLQNYDIALSITNFSPNNKYVTEIKRQIFSHEGQWMYNSLLWCGNDMKCPKWSVVNVKTDTFLTKICQMCKNRR